MTLRRIAALAVLLSGAAFAAVELRYFFHAARFCHPARRPITDADRAAARAQLPQLQEVSFGTPDGLNLRGFYVPSKNGALVIMGHGLGENRMRFLPDASMLARHGYGSLFFDSRAHGDSDGDTSTWSDREQADLRAAVDFALRRPDVIGGRIATLGFSVSASTVVLEAAGDPRVKAVIALAIWPSLEEEIRHKMGKRGIVSSAPALAGMRHEGVDFDHVRPIDRVAALAPRPLLIVLGSLDTDTPVPIGSRVFDAASQPKQMWIVEGAGHGEYFDVAPADYERTIMGFVDQALLGVRPE